MVDNNLKFCFYSRPLSSPSPSPAAGGSLYPAQGSLTHKICEGLNVFAALGKTFFLRVYKRSLEQELCKVKLTPKQGVCGKSLHC